MFDEQLVLDGLDHYDGCRKLRIRKGNRSEPDEPERKLAEMPRVDLL